MKFFVQVSGKNYLDQVFEYFGQAEKYAAECGFPIFADSVSNGNTVDSYTYFYIAENDNLANYPFGYEPCIIEEIEE